jgi:hypothetical protein
MSVSIMLYEKQFDIQKNRGDRFSGNFYAIFEVENKME